MLCAKQALSPKAASIPNPSNNSILSMNQLAMLDPIMIARSVFILNGFYFQTYSDRKFIGLLKATGRPDSP